CRESMSELLCCEKSPQTTRAVPGPYPRRLTIHRRGKAIIRRPEIARRCRARKPERESTPRARSLQVSVGGSWRKGSSRGDREKPPAVRGSEAAGPEQRRGRELRLESNLPLPVCQFVFCRKNGFCSSSPLHTRRMILYKLLNRYRCNRLRDGKRATMSPS